MLVGWLDDRQADLNEDVECGVHVANFENHKVIAGELVSTIVELQVPLSGKRAAESEDPTRDLVYDDALAPENGLCNRSVGKVPTLLEFVDATIVDGYMLVNRPLGNAPRSFPVKQRLAPVCPTYQA